MPEEVRLPAFFYRLSPRAQRCYLKSDSIDRYNFVPNAAALARTQAMLQALESGSLAAINQAAQHLVRGALPALTMDDQMRVEIVERGCRRAQALIALLCGELDLKAPNGNATNYPRTMAALMHPDGWEMIATALSAALIKDAGSGKDLDTYRQKRK